MSDFILEIVEPTTTYLDISTSFINNINNIEIERSENYNLEIINTEKILVSDLPDDIPISKITGNLHYSRITGLSGYISSVTSPSGVRVEDLRWGTNNIGLNSYLDQYKFDLGSP